MKKLVVLFLALFVLTACNSKGYSLNIPKNWKVTEQTESKIVVQVPTGELETAEYTIDIYDKSAEPTFIEWLKENKEKLGSTVDNICKDALSDGKSNAYNCGTAAPEFYLVNLEDTKVMVLFPGEKPAITLTGFRDLVEFK